MRAVFFVLVALNACLFGWGTLFSEKSSVVNSRGQYSNASFAKLPSLTMLSEMDNVELMEVANKSRSSASVISSRKGVVNSSKNQPLCEMVGPFKNKRLAQDFMERLKAIDIKNELKELELPSGPGYWVYLTPKETRRQALKKLQELQAQGVDSYVIPKGSLANGISLGMFSQKKLAELRLEEMKNFGLAPKLEVIERTYRELWVMLKEGEQKKMSDITWGRIMENYEKLERRQNFCVLDVASEDNIH